jgi:hypothetical protein
MSDDHDSVDMLVQKLRWLRLPGMAKLLPSLIELAANDNLSTLDVVHRLCDEEKQSRLRSAVERRICDARFPEVNTVDAFDFDFDPLARRCAPDTWRSTISPSSTRGTIRSSSGTRAPGHRQDVPGARPRLQGMHRRPSRRLHLRAAHAQRPARPSCMEPSSAHCVATPAPTCSSSTTSPCSPWTPRKPSSPSRSSSSATTKVFPDALNAQVIAERLTERSEHFVLDGKGFRNPAPKA